MRPMQSKCPTFLWQGLLILLPVLLLAGLGLLSLRQDRRLAEQDAQQRAREMVRQASAPLAEAIGGQILQYLRDAQVWDGMRTHWRPAWPQGGATRIWPAGGTEKEQWLAAWTARYPKLDPDAALLSSAQIAKGGEWIIPRLWSWQPTPPVWWSSMPAALRELWDVARALEARRASSNEIEAAWREVQESLPGAAAQPAMELALLRLEVSASDPAGAVERLCQFSQEHEQSISETGLPLAAVGLGMALQRSNALPAPLLDTLERQLSAAPSLLCPYFLNEFEQRAGAADEAVKMAVKDLRRVWEREERLRELARALQERAGNVLTLGSNLWLDVGSGRWLALIEPDEHATSSAGNGPPLALSDEWRRVGFVPKPALDHIVAEALSKTVAGWPEYLRCRAELEGQPAGAAAAGEALASATALLNPQVQIHVSQSDPDSNASNREKHDQPAWKHPPRLVLTACLASPDELYARQRTRSLWFTALITAVAAAAVAGFVRARRAFWREHQLGELKTNFVSSVSHELRAPIASVRLMAESLARGKVEDPGRQREYFGFIVQECRRLTSLVANVLDFSRIEQGRKEYEFEPTDVAELVRQTTGLMAPHAAEREIVLREQLPPKDHASFQPVIDGHAVQQALINLLDNALKHAPPRSCVTVGLERLASAAGRESDAAWRLWVQDHGPGVPAAEQDRIFERFYRLGSELRRDTQGVGIGLSIVKHIAEAHRAEVWVESAPGQGSRFIIEFPSHE